MNPPSGATDIAVGMDHYCAILSDGSLICSEPALQDQISPVETYESVDTTYDLTCALRTDGGIDCWGYRGGSVTRFEGTFVSVAVGMTHACGLSDPGLTVAPT